MGVSENLDESALRGGRLCVVGNINRDLKTAPLVASDRLFQDGETSVSSIVETIGGGGANSACIAAALGFEGDTLVAGGCCEPSLTMAAIAKIERRMADFPGKGFERAEFCL